MDTRRPQQPSRSAASSGSQSGAAQGTGSPSSKGSEFPTPAGAGASSTTPPASPQASKGTGSQSSPGSSGSPKSTGQQAPFKSAGASEAPLQPSVIEDPRKAARDLAAEAGNAAASLSSDLQQTAKAATRAVQEQATAFASDLGHELSKTAEQQKVRGVEAMQGLARAITTAAGELENQSPTVARYVREAAQSVEGLSKNIHGRSVTDLMQAATGLAKSQPAVFFAGAMAAGFALSRFLKSSAPASADDSGNGTRSRPGGAGSYGAHRSPGTQSSFAGAGSATTSPGSQSVGGSSAASPGTKSGSGPSPRSI